MRILLRIVLGGALFIVIVMAITSGSVKTPIGNTSGTQSAGSITPFYTPGKDPSPVIPGAPPPRAPDPADSVKVDFKWRKGGFGSIALLDLTFTNGNSHAVKDIGVRCRFYGPSGTEIGRTDRTIFEALGPKGKKTVREVSFGFIDQQASTASCEVLSARI